MTTRIATRFLLLVFLVSLASCNSTPASPTPPPPPPTVEIWTAPLEGVVREVNGGPLGGAIVAVLNAPGSASFVTDGLGRFALPPVKVTTATAVLQVAHGDYVTHRRSVSTNSEPSTRISTFDIALQPQLSLVEETPLQLLLTNDDMDYGLADDALFGLPGERGPVKIVSFRASHTGTIHLSASWSGTTELHMWAEKYYAEEHVTASGVGDIHLALAPRWAADPLNTVVITIGLPRTARASGGLPAPVAVTLTATSAWPSQ